MYKDISSCGCSEAVELETYAVCAGDACSIIEGIAQDCGSAETLPRLPQVHILEQKYVYGFTPEEALARGTMFPELVN